MVPQADQLLSLRIERTFELHVLEVIAQQLATERPLLTPLSVLLPAEP